MAKDLEFRSKQSFFAQKYGNDNSIIVYAFEILDENIKLPFYYATKVLNLPRPTRNAFSATNLKFNGTLRPLQKEVKKSVEKCVYH